MTPLQLLDVVALLEDVPSKGIYRGQVGTIVETLPPDVFEVEFSDRDGRAYAMLALRADQLLRLRFEATAPGEGWLTQPPAVTAR